MIEVATGSALIGALNGINGSMSGLTLQQAWDQQGFVDPVDAGYGLDFGANVFKAGENKPAISGDTASSIVSSQLSNPQDAWQDYVDDDPSKVDSTTGGIVDGSTVVTSAYSLMQVYNSATQQNEVKAVSVVGVPIETAYSAAALTLGVAMDAAEMEVATKQAFAQSIIDGQGLIFDKAKGLVKAWWDGTQILFSRALLDAVQGTLDELGIAPGGTVIPPSGYTFTNINAIGGVASSVGFRSTASGSGVYYIYEVPEGSYIVVYGINTANNVSGYYCITRNSSVTYKRKSIYSPSPGVTEGEWSEVTLSPSMIRFNLMDGSAAYSFSFTSSVYGHEYEGPAIWNVTGSNATTRQQVGTVVLLGTISGDYPDGIYDSQAPSYTTASVPSAGSLAKTRTETEDLVPIHLPEDPLDTRDSTDDPVATPTNPEQQEDLPLPPVPLPIPDTHPSNPDVSITDSSVVNSTLINELVEELANTVDPQPGQSSGIIPIPLLPGITDPISGQRTFPSIIPSSGPGFIHVYNPTPAEFVAFGTWLWVTYADATIEKILNNPFDGVIGAHELYATPNRDGRDNIRSAFLTCPTTADLVTNRYSEIDCGTVIIPEFYGNYLDYSPYSQAYIYLPFIGINEVSIDDIVGHAVNIRYRVDSYSGSCIAMIFVAKDGYQNLCYQFAGSCSVEVPMAGGSQAAIKAGMMQAEAYARAAMIQAGANVVGGIGSALMGNIGGVLSSLSGIASNYAQAQAGVESARVANKSSVQHSGQFGSSHGAMGEKIPFFIIRNPVQVKVVNYNEDYGFPAHKRVIVGGCRGYLRVREVNVISAHATDEEKMAIEMALKGGVYVS